MIANTSMLYGMRIVEHRLAFNTLVTWEVQRHPTKKRRRNWAAVRVTREVPTAILHKPTNTVYMHPTLMAQLKVQQFHRAHGSKYES